MPARPWVREEPWGQEAPLVLPWSLLLSRELQRLAEAGLLPPLLPLPPFPSLRVLAPLLQKQTPCVSIPSQRSLS